MLLFFGQKSTQILEEFELFFVLNQGFLAFQKEQKNTDLRKMATTFN